jgi:hypothetical protein
MRTLSLTFQKSVLKSTHHRCSYPSLHTLSSATHLLVTRTLAFRRMVHPRTGPSPRPNPRMCENESNPHPSSAYAHPLPVEDAPRTRQTHFASVRRPARRQRTRSTRPCGAPNEPNTTMGAGKTNLMRRSSSPRTNLVHFLPLEMCGTNPTGYGPKAEHLMQRISHLRNARNEPICLVRYWQTGTNPILPYHANRSERTQFRRVQRPSLAALCEAKPIPAGTRPSVFSVSSVSL